MRILVLSDSHAGLSFMRRCVEKTKPDAIVHLGDYFDDARVLSEEYPHIPIHVVPGNCDKYRLLRPAPEILCYEVCGVRLFMTHGHRHHVKQTLIRLLADARASRVAVVLFGHTHSAYCAQEEDGLWVMNPGSCGYFGGSVGLLEVRGRDVLQCRVLREEDINVL